jgi:hypothetical protein
VLRKFGSPNRIVAGMPLGVVVIEGAQYSGSLITTIGDGVRQRSVLVTSAEVVIEELPTPIRAALVQAEKPEAEQRSLLASASLNGTEKKL